MRPAARIGDSVEDIDTPALVVDLDALERNIAKMAAFAAAAGVRLRPHAKTHKCPDIARLQIAAGAVGQCVQKVGEAEALVAGGVRDVLVTNQVVGESKLRRLAALADRATIALCFDDPGQVDAASRAAVEAGVTLGGLVEIEIAMRRCGIAPGPAAWDLAERIANAPNLEFRGLQAYHGEAQHLVGYPVREQAIQGAIEIVRASVAALAERGLSCAFVTGAGTGTFPFEAASGVYNELQVGSYVFMDREYADVGGQDGGLYSEFEHSLFVFATVISTPAPDRAVLDAGLKSMSGEKGLPRVHARRGVEAARLSDEHTTLRVDADDLRIGDKLWLIPGHCDPTVNLHDWFVGIRGGRVEALWEIAARGASR
jgi:D-serine deaminase-like pyridoxal phosphate-dependent protein